MRSSWNNSPILLVFVDHLGPRAQVNSHNKRPFLSLRNSLYPGLLIDQGPLSYAFWITVLNWSFYFLNYFCEFTYSTAHTLKLEWCREDEHGPWARRTWEFVSHSRHFKENSFCVCVCMAVEPRASWMLVKATTTESHPQSQTTSSLGCITNSSVFLAGDTEHMNPFVMPQALLWTSLAYWAEKQGIWVLLTPYLYVKGYDSSRHNLLLSAGTSSPFPLWGLLSSLLLFTAWNQTGQETCRRSGYRALGEEASHKQVSSCPSANYQLWNRLTKIGIHEEHVQFCAWCWWVTRADLGCCFPK